MAARSGNTSAERSRKRTGDRSAYPPPPRSAAMTSGALTLLCGGPTRGSPGRNEPVASRDHEREGEAVVALGADGLHGRGEQPRLGADQLDEAARALDGRVIGRWIGDPAAAHDV